LLIALFLIGILGLLALRYAFDHMTGELNNITMNQRVRKAIGHDIANDINDLESGYFQLAPLSGYYDQRILTQALQEIISDIKRDLNVLENGGSFDSVSQVNIGLNDRITTHYVYEADPSDLYYLIAIELRPKLIEVGTHIEELKVLLEERMRYRRSEDPKAFFVNIKRLKAYLMKSIPLFRRMKEDANNLLYDSAQKLEEMEQVVIAKKRQYRQIEAGLTLAIICAVLALSVLIFGKIKTIVRKEHDAVEEVHRSAAFLKTILESITHPFYVIDAETYQITMANSAADAQSIHLDSPLCHKYIFGRDKRCSNYDKSCPMEVIKQAGESLVFEQVRVIGDQEQFLEIHGYPILDQDGKVVQMVEYCIDITEQKREEEEKKALEEKVSRLRKMDAMGMMAGGIAHDLNNILSGIVAYPDMLLSDLPPDSDMREPLKTIGESGKRAAAVVADLLTIARGVAHLKEIKNLNDLINTYLQSAEYVDLEGKYPRVRVETSLDQTLMNIACSPIHIQKILMNLVMNATEAIVDEGIIRIDTENLYLDKPVPSWDGVGPGEYVRLVISDSGVGISKEDIERIFEPFYTKRVQGRTGTGLGLAVVWNTVLDHDGGIMVTSGAEGTRFELLFPASREEAVEASKDISISEIKGNGQTVLVIDDDKTQRIVAQGLLKTLGYQTYTVCSGEKAVEFLQKQSVDLLLLDMIMDPGIDGLETFRQIRAIRPEQKALIASGFSESERVRTAQYLGAGAFLRKPYTMFSLGLAVRKELV